MCQEPGQLGLSLQCRRHDRGVPSSLWLCSVSWTVPKANCRDTLRELEGRGDLECWCGYSAFILAIPSREPLLLKGHYPLICCLQTREEKDLVHKEDRHARVLQASLLQGLHGLLGVAVEARTSCRSLLSFLSALFLTARDQIQFSTVGIK